MLNQFRNIKKSIEESQIKKSIFRVGIPNTDRKRVLIMLGNVFLHLHPTKVRTSGVKLRYTWCAGGLSFFLFILLTVTGIFLMFFYRPTDTLAWSDINNLQTSVTFSRFLEIL